MKLVEPADRRVAVGEREQESTEDQGYDAKLYAEDLEIERMVLEHPGEPLAIAFVLALFLDLGGSLA